MQLLPYLVKHTQLPEKGIKNTVELLNEDCTIPFIARYRKEKTGNLDEVQIGQIVEFKTQFENLEKRKETILKAIEEQDSLTEDLKNKIVQTEDLTSLEDLYLPFKKKRKTGEAAKYDFPPALVYLLRPLLSPLTKTQRKRRRKRRR